MICRFGEVVREVKKKIDRDNNPYKYYIAGNHMDTDELRLLRKGNFATDDVGPAFIRLFRPGQVLYGSRRTYLRKVAVADFEGVTANTTFVLETKDESKFSQRLLPFLIQSERFTHYSILHSKGSTNPYVLFSDLCDFEFELPPLDKQRELADVLWSIEDTRTAYQELATATEELVKSRFIEMFGDTKLNTKKWKTVKLDSIADVGSSKRVFVEELLPEGIPFYRGTEIGALAEGKSITPELHITEEHYKTLCEASGTPQKGDLLMPSICPDGRIWLVDTDKPFYFKDGRVLWVHLNGNDFNSVFVQFVLKSKMATEYEHIASGTTFKELKIFTLKSLDIVMPPLALQNQFADFVALADKSKLVVKETLEKIAAMKAAVMREWLK